MVTMTGRWGTVLPAIALAALMTSSVLAVGRAALPELHGFGILRSPVPSERALPYRVSDGVSVEPDPITAGPAALASGDPATEPVAGAAADGPGAGLGTPSSTTTALPLPTATELDEVGDTDGRLRNVVGDVTESVRAAQPVDTATNQLPVLPDPVLPDPALPDPVLPEIPEAAPDPPPPAQPDPTPPEVPAPGAPATPGSDLADPGGDEGVEAAVEPQPAPPSKKGPAKAPAEKPGEQLDPQPVQNPGGQQLPQNANASFSAAGGFADSDASDSESGDADDDDREESRRGGPKSG